MTPRNSYIVRRCDEIEKSLEDAEEWSKKDAKLGAFLAGHVTVLISGVVEDCIEYLVRERVDKCKDPELTSLVAKLIDQRFRNPNSESIANLLSMFGPSYQARYQASVPIPSREALGSIMSNRFALSHTGAWQQQSTVNDVKDYFRRIVPILGVVEDILLN